MRCSMQWIVVVALAVNLMGGGWSCTNHARGRLGAREAGTAAEQGKAGMVRCRQGCSRQH